MAPSATKRHSANLWIAPSSSLGLAKTYDSVFPTRVKALAIMVQSSSVPKRSIMTPPSPGKRPKSFTALNTARLASRKSAKCSGNGELVAGFCASLCSRPRPIARLRRGGAITGKRHTCCATTTSWLPKNFCKPTSIVGKLKSTIATKRISLEWVGPDLCMTHSKDILFVAMVDFNLPTIELGLQKFFGSQLVVVAQQVCLLPLIAPPLLSLAIGRGREHKEAQKPATTEV